MRNQKQVTKGSTMKYNCDQAELRRLNFNLLSERRDDGLRLYRTVYWDSLVNIKRDGTNREGVDVYTMYDCRRKRRTVRLCRNQLKQICKQVSGLHVEGEEDYTKEHSKCDIWTKLDGGRLKAFKKKDNKVDEVERGEVRIPCSIACRLDMAVEELDRIKLGGISLLKSNPMYVFNDWDWKGSEILSETSSECIRMFIHADLRDYVAVRIVFDERGEEKLFSISYSVYEESVLRISFIQAIEIMELIKKVHSCRVANCGVKLIYRAVHVGMEECFIGLRVSDGFVHVGMSDRLSGDEDGVWMPCYAACRIASAVEKLGKMDSGKQAKLDKLEKRRLGEEAVMARRDKKRRDLLRRMDQLDGVRKKRKHC